jgi:hypothetical protein
MGGIDAVAPAGAALRVRIMPVARTRARSAPAGRHDPAARGGVLPDIIVFGLKIHSHPYSTSHVSQCVSSYGAIGVEHYEVPPDVDASVHLHPSTTGIGPWSRGTLTPYVMPISDETS